VLRGVTAVASAVGVLIASGATATTSPLDRTFGHDGVAVVQGDPGCAAGHCAGLSGSWADAVALQASGDVVIGGPAFNAAKPDETDGGAIARLTVAGRIDRSFGDSGSGIMPIPFRASAIYASAGDALLVVGTQTRTINESLGAGLPPIKGLQTRTAVAELSASGVPNASFGPQGVRWLTEPSLPEAEAVDSAGRIVAAGNTSPGGVAVVRYRPDGTLDGTFGSGGFVRLRVGPGPQVDGMALERDGSVLVSGGVGLHLRGDNVVSTASFLVRLGSRGVPDPLFGRGGAASVPAAASFPSVAVAPGGAVVVIATDRSSGHALVVARYTPAGRLDPDFARGGVAITALPSAARVPWQVSPAATAFDGKDDLVVVGQIVEPTVPLPAGAGFAVRYTARGSDCSTGTRGVVIARDVEGLNAAVADPAGRIVAVGETGKAMAATRYAFHPPVACGR
jgi:uncharacterized delta-60 repeat protein